MSHEFILVGKSRICCSNIKHYGVTKEKQRKIEKINFFNLFSFPRAVIRDARVLFITTYQGDNFRFSEFDMDIDSVLNKLDRFFGHL